MDTEFLDAFVQKSFYRFGHLRTGKTVFRVGGIAHYTGAYLEISARVVTQTDFFGDPCVLFQKIYMGDIVEVDYRIQTAGEDVFFGGGFVTGEHNFVAAETAGFRHKKFRVAGAVHSAAFFFQKFQNGGVGGGFHGEIFLETFVPGKGFEKFPSVVDYSFFVVNMKRSRDFCDDFFGFFFG